MHPGVAGEGEVLNIVYLHTHNTPAPAQHTMQRHNCALTALGVSPFKQDRFQTTTSGCFTQTCFVWCRCRYSQLPRLVKVPGLSAAQLTALNMDKTALLEQVMDRYNTTSSSSSTRSASQQQQQQQQQQGPAGIEVIGELQFAFIAFVFGQSLEGEAKAGCLCVAGCTSTVFSA
jgi:hypothetical protein